ncbi:MAG: hypothetical protein Q4F42_04670 [Rikenellaceae bacterium]|nr:hypothetical protein [Rikenellaceae bacterium]
MTLLLVVAVAAAAAYGILNRPPAENLPANDRVLQILEKGGCASCHSADPTLPGGGGAEKLLCYPSRWTSQ